MTSVTVTYLLSPAGQKAAILAGKPAEREQRVAIADPENLLLEQAEVQGDGRLALSIGGWAVVSDRVATAPSGEPIPGARFSRQVNFRLSPRPAPFAGCPALDAPLCCVADVRSALANINLERAQMETTLPALQEKADADCVARIEEMRRVELADLRAVVERLRPEVKRLRDRVIELEAKYESKDADEEDEEDEQSDS